MSSNTNASGGIHGILVKLHESLTDEDLRSAAFKCQDIIGDLGQECLLSQTDNELGKSNYATGAPLSIAILFVCWFMVRCSQRSICELPLVYNVAQQVQVVKFRNVYIEMNILV